MNILHACDVFHGLHDAQKSHGAMVINQRGFFISLVYSSPGFHCFNGVAGLDIYFHSFDGFDGCFMVSKFG